MYQWHEQCRTGRAQLPASAIWLTDEEVHGSASTCNCASTSPLAYQLDSKPSPRDPAVENSPADQDLLSALSSRSRRPVTKLQAQLHSLGERPSAFLPDHHVRQLLQLHSRLLLTFRQDGSCFQQYACCLLMLTSGNSIESCGRLGRGLDRTCL